MEEHASIKKRWVFAKWIPVTIAASMLFLEASTYRCSGIFYVMIMEEFAIARGPASWPITVLAALSDLGGILAGPLCYLISVKSVLLIGSLANVLGMVGASFAPTLAWMSVTLGFIHGMGGGFIRTLLQVFLSTNYKKHLGMAHGLMFAGATASSFVFPYVLMSLNEAFNARGSMLVVGGILSHLIPLCMLIKQQDGVDVSKNASTNSNIESIRTTEKLTKQETSSGTCSAIALDAGKIMCTPTFYVIVISWLIVVYALELFFMTIVDYAMDRGLSADDAVTLLSGYAVTDLCGRILLPVVADKQYVRSSTLMAANYFLFGSSVFALPEVCSYASLLVVGALAALFMGSGLAMHGVLMAKYIGMERLPLSYSIAALLSCPFVFLKPVFIGYFRDNIGSYDNLYRLLGGLLLCLCAPWSVTTIWERRESKRRTFLQHAYTSCNKQELQENSSLPCQNMAGDCLNV
ncbi:monocarboxylate transporter 6-like [Ixodes scapularis]